VNGKLDDGKPAGWEGRKGKYVIPARRQLV
jgi:hypothetical protein